MQMDFFRRLKRIGAPGVLILATLLLTWQSTWQPEEVFDGAEFCSGKGVLSRCLKHGGYRFPGLDILDWDPYAEAHGVMLGNQMVARFILLALLIYAKKGCWTLEQPKSSLLFRHTRFQWLLRRLVVFRKSFWMKHWGAKTPKRTVMWSSSKNVRWFRTGKLKRGEGGSQAKALVTKYRNSRGETKFQGNKRMAKSSTYPLGFGLQYLSCFSSLQTEGNKLRKQYKVPRLPEHMQINAEFFRSLDWSDIWRDAKMEEVVQYLRFGIMEAKSHSSASLARGLSYAMKACKLEDSDMSTRLQAAQAHREALQKRLQGLVAEEKKVKKIAAPPLPPQQVSSPCPPPGGSNPVVEKKATVEPTPMGTVAVPKTAVLKEGERCEKRTSAVDKENCEKSGTSVVDCEKGDTVCDNAGGATAIPGGSKATPFVENPTTPPHAIRRSRRSPSPPPSPQPSPMPKRPAFAHRRLEKKYDREPDRCPSSWPSTTTLGSEDAPIPPRPVAAPLRTRDLDGSVAPDALEVEDGYECPPEPACPPELVDPKVETEASRERRPRKLPRSPSEHSRLSGHGSVSPSPPRTRKAKKVAKPLVGDRKAEQAIRRMHRIKAVKAYCRKMHKKYPRRKFITRDKYQRNVRKYWVEKEVEGSYEKAVTKDSTRRLNVDMNEDSFSDNDDFKIDGESDQSGSDSEGSSGGNRKRSRSRRGHDTASDDDSVCSEKSPRRPKKKVPKGKNRRTSCDDELSVSEEEPLEEIENVDTMLGQILRTVSNLNALIPKLEKLGTPDANKSAKDVRTRTSTLMTLHDEIAELKAHYDAHKTLTPEETKKLQDHFKKVEAECSKAVMEQNKLKKTTLKPEKKPATKAKSKSKPRGAGKAGEGSGVGEDSEDEHSPPPPQVVPRRPKAKAKSGAGSKKK
eukprot:s1445_g2.t1